jgi:hypothetical protein
MSNSPILLSSLQPYQQTASRLDSNISQPDWRTIARPSQDELLNKPWKYTGYRAFSQFIASDNDFFVLRRFGALNARVILALQDQLSKLEEDLEEIDKRCSELDAGDVNNGSFRQETQKDRRDVIWNIHRKLREYS